MKLFKLYRASWEALHQPRGRRPLAGAPRWLQDEFHNNQKGHHHQRLSWSQGLLTSHLPDIIWDNLHIQHLHKDLKSSFFHVIDNKFLNIHQGLQGARGLIKPAPSQLQIVLEDEPPPGGKIFNSLRPRSLGVGGGDIIRKATTLKGKVLEEDVLRTAGRHLWPQGVLRISHRFVGGLEGTKLKSDEIKKFLKNPHLYHHQRQLLQQEELPLALQTIRVLQVNRLVKSKKERKKIQRNSFLQVRSILQLGQDPNSPRDIEGCQDTRPQWQI